MQNQPDDASELLERLTRHCPFEALELRTKGRPPLHYYKAVHLDPLLETLSQQDDDHPDITDERLPYWAKVWPSALLMAEEILQAVTLPAGPWLELGCGPGIAGIAAGMRGISGTCTDYMADAMDLAGLNTRSNDLQNIACALLDWREPIATEVPWLLASDVAYETRNFPPLLDCFERLLLPGGEIWFAEAGRRIAQPFFSLLNEEGWRREILVERGPLTLNRLTRRSETNGSPVPHR